jgi:hypothetical protein
MGDQRFHERLVTALEWEFPGAVVERTATGAHVYFPDGKRRIVQWFESKAGGVTVYEAAKAQREARQ